MGDAYLAIREQIVALGLQIAERMGLQEEILHDAVLLMDRVMSTGARVRALFPRYVFVVLDIIKFAR